LTGEQTLNIHNCELDLIEKYSPFKNQATLKDQFKKIEGDSGTLVVCNNLKLLDNGQSELDIDSDEHDIKIANSKVKLQRKIQIYSLSPDMYLLEKSNILTIKIQIYSLSLNMYLLEKSNILTIKVKLLKRP